jgi:hypothetical protein
MVATNSAREFKYLLEVKHIRKMKYKKADKVSIENNYNSKIIFYELTKNKALPAIIKGK